MYCSGRNAEHTALTAFTLADQTVTKDKSIMHLRIRESECTLM